MGLREGCCLCSAKKYADAETDLTEAIRLSVRNAGLFINRALARFHQNNLRGAMSDYDLALDIDPNNFLGHYNRGLLRAQTGDYRGAIQNTQLLSISIRTSWPDTIGVRKLAERLEIRRVRSRMNLKS